MTAGSRDTSAAPVSTLPLLDHGFRPFFLGAGLWAALAVMLWAATLGHGLHLPTAFAPAAWHAHAMLFGFLGAALAGFLTTAVPNWTGRAPLRGAPLGGLALLWFAGRVACLTSAVIGPVAAAVIDVGFFVALVAFVLLELVAAKNWRNLLVVGGLAGVAGANLLTHLGPITGLDTGYGNRLGVGMFALLIVLIGGRIVPAFTRNWLKQAGETRLPAMWGRFDSVAALLMLAAVVSWVVAPASGATGALALAAGAINAVRLIRWRGWLACREPLILVLHLGYLWLAAGFLLLGWQALQPGLIGTSALHVLTAGAMGTFVLAVMTRASLGHTGRPLHANRPTLALFAALKIAFVCRVAAPLLPTFYLPLLTAAGVAWAVAFGGFALIYAPMLLAARQR